MTVTETGEQTHFDPAVAEAFGGQMMGILKGHLLSTMIDIGHRTGLFAAAAEGWATSEELAARAGLTERYVREWLGAVATGGIVDYDVETDRYFLRPEHAALLIGPTSMAPLATMNTVLVRHVHQVVDAFRDGGGVPYAAFVPEFSEAMDVMGRGVFDLYLIDGYLPIAPGLIEKLTEGAKVADVACGSGHALVLLAKAFPQSTFVGYDLDEHAIGRARAEAAGAGLNNIRFEVTDATRLPADHEFDVVFVFEALHDQVDPEGFLAAIHRALVPGGLFFLREPCVGDTVAENLEHPFAPIVYSVSTLHCLTVSLAHGGAGIGTAFGRGHATRLLVEAGFAEPEIGPAPGQPFDAVYVTRSVA